MKLENITKMAVVAAMGGMLLTSSASATLTINSGTSAVYLNQASDPSTSDITTALSNAGWDTTLGSLLYKAGRDDSGEQFTANINESGPLESSYATTSGAASDNSGGYPIVISYTGGTVAVATYLVVKDGNLGAFIFDLSGWNGTEEIDIYNLFDFSAHPKKDVKGVSHVEFFGSEGHTTSVPEPSTIVAGALLLLPFGVSTVRILRKNRTA